MPAMEKNPAYKARVVYDDAKSAEYDQRSEKRHEAEMKLLEPALKLFATGASVLDAPCGAGRVSVRLAELGMRVTAADISAPMVRLTREKLRAFGKSPRVLLGDMERLSFPDRFFDGAVCFRFFHHLPTDELRERVVGELCRVSRQRVVLSFFHPISADMMTKQVKRRVLGKETRRFAIYPARLDEMFAPRGFRCVKLSGQSKYLRTLWLAVYERRR